MWVTCQAPLYFGVQVVSNVSNAFAFTEIDY